ncbi:PaaI family thioesterase [Corallincola spongiicola]|nr:PaaI family thioesterase [Corallincola spongiicola]
MSELVPAVAAANHQSLAASHQHCIACGDPQMNPLTLGLGFSTTSASSVAADCRITAAWQGYSGIMHGGVISTLLDAAMTHCLFHHGVKALTAELNVKFVRPVAVGLQLRVSAALVKQRRGVFWLNAELADSSAIYATAAAKFVRAEC